MLCNAIDLSDNIIIIINGGDVITGTTFGTPIKHNLLARLYRSHNIVGIYNMSIIICYVVCVSNGVRILRIFLCSQKREIIDLF